MMSKFRAYLERIKERYTADELFRANEVEANGLAMKYLIVNAVIFLLVHAGVTAGIFPVTGAIFPALIRCFAWTVILYLVSKKVNQDAWWLKYLLLISVTLMYSWLDSLLTHKVAILMVLPVLCSSRFFSKRTTVKTALITWVIFLLSAIQGGLTGWINMNDVRLPVGSVIVDKGVWLGSGIEETLDRVQYTKDTLLFSFVPKSLMFLLATLVCVNIAEQGRKMVEKQRKLSENSARMETELRMATQIQEGMLPNIYPPFPERREFDIYGTMNPAREVGGDFYDFFLVDEDNLALVVADVSGKGVPAALFMMAAKIILANNAMMGLSPAQVLAATNSSVCASNPEEMFITVWFGILEISTGRLTAANAGHEYPVLKQGDRFELFKDRHGLVLGAMDGVKYKEYTIQLSPGDKIFLYSDGVPEATDSNNKLFGTDRMLEALNQRPESPARNILADVQEAVDEFVGTAEQFDDLTMLCLEYRGN